MFGLCHLLWVSSPVSALLLLFAALSSVPFQSLPGYPRAGWSLALPRAGSPVRLAQATAVLAKHMSGVTAGGKEGSCQGKVSGLSPMSGMAHTDVASKESELI